MRPSMFPLSRSTRITVTTLVAALSFGAASGTPLSAQQPATVKPASQPATKTGSATAAVATPVKQPPAAKTSTPAVSNIITASLFETIQSRIIAKQ